MIKPDVTVALLDPGLNGTPSVFSVDLTTLREDGVNSGVFKSCFVCPLQISS